jgi:hypothetical protein
VAGDRGRSRTRLLSRTDTRRSTLYAALAFCQLAASPRFPEVAALKRWLSTWNGIGHIVVGMERQGFVVRVRRLVDDGWAASFQGNALLAPAGRSTEPTPFGAVQRAAWQALNHKPMGSRRRRGRRAR